ncbi:intraflagellar transport protein 20 homolog isoform X1 [Episyrphus balteatus]|uniref:intraflagellar transport protein 20 homolog isoform X1 n=1 Tax=Episyrphus balteatus TaxID=286459 RepID=UPI002484F751|nr:intraflagellar transport protein 20 homolog isoform X1 [Episyrphus balteatus]
MAEELQKAGLYIDDIYRLRVQDPKIASEANELREECLEFATKLQDFKRYAEEFQKIFNDFSKDVEKERIRAISTQNLLKTIAKQRQAEQQIFQSQIHEKSIELERLKTEYHHLQMIESEQQEIINNFVQNQ